MFEKQININNLSSYQEYLIKEFYNSNFKPFEEAFSDNIIGYGPNDSNLLIGKENIYNNIIKMINASNYELGPITETMIKHGENHCNIISIFTRTAFYPNDIINTLTFAFNISWTCKNGIWKIDLFTSSIFNNENNITTKYPINLLNSLISSKENSKVLSLKEKDTNNTIFIHINQIIYAESYGHYTKIHFENKTIIVKKELKELLKESENILIKIHSSFIVNPKQIKSISRFKVELFNGETLPIPEKKYTETKKILIEIKSNIEI